MTTSEPTFDRTLCLLARAFDDPHRAPQTHKLAVMALLEADEPLPKKDIAQKVGRSPRQLTRVVRDLEKGGVIEREYRAGVRPAHWFTVAEDG